MPDLLSDVLHTRNLMLTARDLRTDLLRVSEIAAPVTRATPRLSWALRSAEPEARQTAFEVRLAATAENVEASPLWTSGKVPSSETAVSVPPGVLSPGTAYVWTVQLWNASDKPGPVSDPAPFETASTLDPAAYPSRPRQVQTPVAPIEVIDKTAGHVFLDFGRAAFGTLRFRVPGAGGGEGVTVHFGEKADGAATVDRTPGGTIRYLATGATVAADGGWVTVVVPDYDNGRWPSVADLPAEIGQVVPFRYVEIEGLPGPVTAADVEQLAVHTPWDDSAAAFRSSDDILNQVWDLCKYSIKATSFAAIYVDGDRERLPYEADAYINQLAHYGCEPSYALARFSHEWLLDHPTWPTEWRSHSVLMAWEDWLYTGDPSSLARCYDRLKEKLFPGAERADGLIHPPTRDNVDWPITERDGYEFKDYNTVINAFQYAALRRMAGIARVLGEDAEAADFDNHAETLYASFNTVFWDETNRRYVDGEGSTHSSQHANLFPLALGLVPADRVDDVRAFVESKDMACSVYAAHYLLEGLFAHCGADHAVDLMRDTGTRSWTNMIREGSTISMEAWGQRFKPNQDWNHAWGAAPAAAIPRWVLGVRPAAPGWTEIHVSPHLGGLDWIEGTVPTLRGGVEVRVTRDGDTGLTGQVTVPPGCRFRLELPLPPSATGKLRMNGEPVAVIVDGGRIRLPDALPAGHFQLDVR